MLSEVIAEDDGAEGHGDGHVGGPAHGSSAFAAGGGGGSALVTGAPYFYSRYYGSWSESARVPPGEMGRFHLMAVAKDDWDFSKTVLWKTIGEHSKCST